MNFKKEQLKEVSTFNDATDIVVFEKGSNVPKRIKKSKLIGDSQPKIYKAIISQSGTNDPTVDHVFTNTIGVNPTFEYVNVGNYNIIFSNNPFVDENKIFHDFNSTDNAVGATMYWNQEDSFGLQTTDLSTVTGGDGLMYKFPILIEVYS